jgi:hydroxymethylbilane synthase
MKVLKLGTRRSLLAWTQSSWVADRIKAAHPDVKIELVGIETRGDVIQNVSLQNVEGKEFFVAELDAALKNGQVDLTVHSLKDLSLERPHEFVCEAIPKRENPRDAVLFTPKIIEKLKAGRKIKIGTSSPRRLENLPPFLKQALPFSPQIEFTEIRGNVNTRLSRVHEDESSPKYLDAVVLAAAGLIRLWNGENSRPELSKLLAGVRWMILPLKECPTAPGQGALAVECRKDDIETRARVRSIHDENSARAVGLERALLAEWGGGCHQRFGATLSVNEWLGDLLFVRGTKPDFTFVEETEWKKPSRPSKKLKSWDSSEWRAEKRKTEPLQVDPALSFAGRSVFVSHWRAASSVAAGLSSSRLWASGTQSWFELAKLGLWVEGCAEGFGFADLQSTLNEPVLQLSNWMVLTHSAGLSSWEGIFPKASVIPTYRVEEALHAIPDLKDVECFFWSSGSIARTLTGSTEAKIPKNAIHCCGPGKTVKQLGALGLNPLVFPDREEWKKWLNR